MARKNLLASITEEKLTTVNSTAAASPAPSTPFARHGAFGAVTRTIDDMAAKAQDIEARLLAGDTVVDLDPAMIDVSFMADRLAQDDAEFESLVEAIRSRGQDSPILVRPHPTTTGRYQVAFGHRRLRAAQRLQRQVRAVVKRLTDRDLVVAQGQENSARANLSFIERALFASRLELAGYDRETIIAALGVDKTVISRMISVAGKIPQSLIDAVGPAPTTGRDRWVEFASALNAESASTLAEIISSKAFVEAASDERFNLLAARLAKPTTPTAPKEDQTTNASVLDEVGWRNRDGALIARMKSGKHAFSLSIDSKAAPRFGEFLASRLNELYAEYVESQLRQNE
jgi:ParB family transcriptional regulator, chromosome partitioning protein